jgi:hypothetical protein
MLFHGDLGLQRWEAFVGMRYVVAPVGKTPPGGF